MLVVTMSAPREIETLQNFLLDLRASANKPRFFLTMISSSGAEDQGRNGINLLTPSDIAQSIALLSLLGFISTYVRPVAGRQEASPNN